MQQITDNQTYKQILAESFGGVMYNVANYGKYDTTELMALWDNLTPTEQSAADGITKGVINFINEGAK